MSQYFQGQYYKHHQGKNTLAIIPGKTAQHAFIWVVTPHKSWFIKYPLSSYRSRGSTTNIARNTFSPQGIQVNIKTKHLTLAGKLTYHNLTPAQGNIMGPFAWLPMECSHSITSMHHTIRGALTLNSKTLDFTHGVGYIEGDRGTSFPQKYAWVQCNSFGDSPHNKVSIMAAVATIPVVSQRFTFTGVIAVVHINGKEHRLATYKGAKVKQLTPKVMVITQGQYKLYIKTNKKKGRKLPAPQHGSMTRWIKENIQTHGEFILMRGKACLLYARSKHTAKEYEWD